MTIRDFITKSIYGWGKAARPDNFDLGIDSTLHKTSSVDNIPALSSYKSPVIKTKTPTNLNRKGPIKKYLDNPPK